MKLNITGYHADFLEKMKLAGGYDSASSALRMLIQLHGEDFLLRFSKGSSTIPQMQPDYPPSTAEHLRTISQAQSDYTASVAELPTKPKLNPPPEW